MVRFFSSGSSGSNSDDDVEFGKVASLDSATSRHSLGSAATLDQVDVATAEDKGPPFEFVRIHPDDIVHLRDALKSGEHLKAAFDVGDFLEGAQLLAGGDLNFEALDIFGLQAGDEIDHKLEHDALEAVACLADENREAQLAVRPPYVVQELAEKGKKERTDHTLPARLKNCCLAMMRSCCARRKWHRRRRWRDRMRGCMRCFEACIVKLCFSRAVGGIEKRYDVFICCEMQDRDLAHWVLHFCEHRSWSVYADPPCEQVRKFIKRTAREKEDDKDDDAADEEQSATASGGASARTGSSASSRKSKLTDIPCMEWLRRRRTAIGASRVVIVILNDECFENAFVVQECVWAYANSVPILPIYRNGGNTNVKQLSRQIPCVFRAGFGAPSAGPGANRHKLSLTIERAIVKSLLVARYAKSRNKLPKGAKQQFIFSCKKLQALCRQGRLEEFDQFDEYEGEEPEEEVLQQEDGEEERKEVDPEALDEELEEDKKAHEQLTLAEQRELAEVDKEMKRQEIEDQKEAEASLTRLSLEHEERVYGIIAAIALHGSTHYPLTIDGVDALRRVSRVERGCMTIAQYSGVSIIMRCAHNANKSKSKTNRRARRGSRWTQLRKRIKSCSEACHGISRNIRAFPGARCKKCLGLGSSDDLGGEHKVNRCHRCRCFLIFCICCACCARRKKSGHRSSHGESETETIKKGGCRQRCGQRCRNISSYRKCCGRRIQTVDYASRAVDRDTCHERWRRCCFFFCLRCCMRERGVRLSMARHSMAQPRAPMEKEWDEILEELPLIVRKVCQCLDKLPCSRRMKFENYRMTRFRGSFSGEKMRRLSFVTSAFANMTTSKAAKHMETMGIAENSLACLRNLACRSTARKSDILNSGGAMIAVKAMKVFADTQGDGVKKAAAGLLRNLSAEVNQGPPILYQAGALSIAKEGLAQANVTTDTERHLLAMVQNIAAHSEAATSYFNGGDSERWLSICAQVVEHAREEKAAKIMQQALSALANLACVRTAESQMSGRLPPSPGGSHRSGRSGKVAFGGSEGMLGNKSARSGSSGSSKIGSKAVTAEDQNDADSQAGSDVEAKGEADEKPLRAAGAADAEVEAKAPAAKRKTTRRTRKTVRRTRKSSKGGGHKGKRNSSAVDAHVNKHMHTGLESTLGWGSSGDVLKQSAQKTEGWGDSEGEEDEGSAKPVAPKKKDNATKLATGGSAAKDVEGHDEEDAESDSSGDEKSEDSLSDEGRRGSEQIKKGVFEAARHSVIGSDDNLEHHESAEDVEHNSSDESAQDADFHSDSSEEEDSDEDLEELEEEGGEEEEKVNDEIVEHDEFVESNQIVEADEEKESLPTDTREYDLSLELAREKVSEKVLESMLHLLTEECSAQDDGRGISTSSVLTVAATIAALCNFAQDVDVERSIGALGGLETVLMAMTAVDDSQVHLQGLRFFLNMSFSHHNQERLIQVGVLPFIFSVLQKHRGEADAEIQEQGCGLLRNLATGPAKQKAQIFRQGASKMIVHALRDYPAHPGTCRQAAAAIRILADGAPPVADEVCDADGMAALIVALRRTGDDQELTEEVLHAIEFVLVTPRARRPFCKACGHSDVLHSMERFPKDSTILRACRTLAGATCITHDFLEQDLSESEEEEAAEENDDDLFARAGGSTANYAKLKKERDEKKKRKIAEAPMRRKPSFRMRLDLAGQGAVAKLCQHIKDFSDNLAVLEAVVGALRNLILDLPGLNTMSLMKNMSLKQSVGSNAELLIRIISKWVDKPEARREAMRFIAIMFTLLASLALDMEAAVLLHRRGAAEKALDWMAMYREDAPVQFTGCAFLKNFSGSLLRVRSEIVECGGVRQVSEILERFVQNPQVLQEAIRALHNFAMADGCGEEAAENLVVRRTLIAVHEHSHDKQINAVGFALLWNISTTNIVASAIFAQDGVESALKAMKQFDADPQIIGNCGGMLRNLLAGEHKEEVSNKISKSEAAGGIMRRTLSKNHDAFSAAAKSEAKPGAHGYSILRESIYRHAYSSLVAEQLLGCLSNIAMLKGEHLETLANEMMTPKEADSLLNLLEGLADHGAVQYQGFSLISHLVSYDRERKRAFNIIVSHGLMMLVVYRNTPVVNMIEACMEEVG